MSCKSATIGIIVPTFGQYDYAVQTVASALQHTRSSCHVLVVDDGHPDYLTEWPRLFQACRPGGDRQCDTVAFPEQGGYIRSLNTGLAILRRLDVPYVCCANSDLLFTPDWDVPLLAALDADFALVGPVTNAPGTEVQQDVSRYLKDYMLTDDAGVLATQAAQLQQLSLPPQNGTLNGFCLLAKTKTWWANRYDADHVFCPRNEKDSRGRRNPTPTMTLNEYELQRRWHAKGLRSGYCPQSFVFHYRSVTRGDRFKKPGWYRKS